MLLIPSLVSIFAIYRFTINFTGLPYSNSLRQSSSAKFRETSQEIVNSLQTLFSSFPGERNISVLNYRYQKVIGTLVTIEVKLRKAEPKLEEIIKRAIKSGYIGRYAVGFNGFEYQTLRGH
ncbi:unnamed protein product [Thelazia callipaeda]|uniref:SEA domain-containing protein n=1 Tax=Thelazia callipaeda TaxID=103827 RepID=A0A0N5CJ65_THECL|nr:unnamed protein product [Thelazia callipaeda]